MKTLFKAIPFLFFVLIFSTCSKEENSGPEGTFTDSRDGKVYKTIKIGNQTWLAENLAYLPAVNSSNEASTTEPRYYVYDYQGNDLIEAKANSNFQTYGVLYNYEAAKIAPPAGWHLPTDEEWKQLEMFLGMSQEEADDHGNRGTDEGDKLKSTSGWDDNGNGNNQSGFNALPGGIRDYNGGFSVIGEWGEFWSSTFDSAANTHAWNRYLTNTTIDVGRWGFEKRFGLSVRCVKD